MNPTNPSTNQSAAGARYFFGWFLDSDGIPIGRTHTRPAAGTSTNGGPVRFRMPQSVTPTSRPSATPLVVAGEDGFDQHRYQFPADVNQITTIALAAEDLEAAGLITNRQLITIAGGTLLPMGEILTPFDMCLLFWQWSRDYASGALRWKPTFYPQATLRYRGGDAVQIRAARVFNFEFVSQPVSYNPWGTTILDANSVQVQGDLYSGEEFDYPFVFQAFTGDNSQQTFALDYKPVNVASTTVYEASPIVGVRAAVERAVASVDTVAPYGFTLTPTPAQDGRGLAIYQFQG